MQAVMKFNKLEQRESSTSLKTKEIVEVLQATNQELSLLQEEIAQLDQKWPKPVELLADGRVVFPYQFDKYHVELILEKSADGKTIKISGSHWETMHADSEQVSPGSKKSINTTILVTSLSELSTHIGEILDEATREASTRRTRVPSKAEQAYQFLFSPESKSKLNTQEILDKDLSVHELMQKYNITYKNGELHMKVDIVYGRPDGTNMPSYDVRIKQSWNIIIASVNKKWLLSSLTGSNKVYRDTSIDTITKELINEFREKTTWIDIKTNPKSLTDALRAMKTSYTALHKN